jgi:hypothetical protein
VVHSFISNSCETVGKVVESWSTFSLTIHAKLLLLAHKKCMVLVQPTMCAARTPKQKCCACDVEKEPESFRRRVLNTVKKDLRECMSCEESAKQPPPTYRKAFVSGLGHIDVDVIIGVCPNYRGNPGTEKRDSDIKTGYAIASELRAMEKAGLTTATEQDALRLSEIYTYLMAMRQLVFDFGFPPERYNDIRTILSNLAQPPDFRGRQILE